MASVQSVFLAVSWLTTCFLPLEEPDDLLAVVKLIAVIADVSTTPTITTGLQRVTPRSHESANQP